MGLSAPTTSTQGMRDISADSPREQAERAEMEAAEKEKKESERLARQVAADIGDGGEGDFVDVRKLV